MKMRFQASFSLVMAAFCLTGCQPTASDPLQADRLNSVDRSGDQIIARVNGTQIYASDVQRAASAQGLISPDETLSFDSPVFRLTAEELIDQRLLMQDAVRQDIPKQDEAQRRLQAARERILGNLRVEIHLTETVNEDSMRALYDAQNSLIGRGEERRLRQIIVDDEATAQIVSQRLEDEEAFADLVAEFSIDEETVEVEGELGWVSRDMLADPLKSPVFRTAVGSRTAPVESELGWHIVEVLDRRSPAPRSYEETREEIQRFMTFEAIQALMTDLRDSATVDRVYETLQEADPENTSEPDEPPASDPETQSEIQPEIQDEAEAP